MGHKFRSKAISEFAMIALALKVVIEMFSGKVPLEDVEIYELRGKANPT